MLETGLWLALIVALQWPKTSSLLLVSQPITPEESLEQLPGCGVLLSVES